MTPLETVSHQMTYSVVDIVKLRQIVRTRLEVFRFAGLDR